MQAVDLHQPDVSIQKTYKLYWLSSISQSNTHKIEQIQSNNKTLGRKNTITESVPLASPFDAMPAPTANKGEPLNHEKPGRIASKGDDKTEPSIEGAVSTPVDIDLAKAQNAPPSYPLIARRHGWVGTVLLKVQIDPAGRVDGIEVTQSSGHQLLDQSALNAVSEWLFRPATVNDRGVASEVLVPIQFRLTS